jgi:hypothetical protein
MSLLSESKVGFLDARQVSSGKTVTTAVLSASVPTVLEGTVKGPILTGGFKAFSDAQGNDLVIPTNAIPTQALVIGNTSFPLASYVTFTDENKIGVSVNMGDFTSEQANAGCFVYLYDVGCSVNLYKNFTIAAVFMPNGPLLADEYIKIKMGYLL